MRNIKFIAVFAAFGFVLSFAFGIFSHTAFLSVLLKAFIFALVFCALGFCISFLSDKFLLDEGNSEFVGESVNSVAAKTEGNSKGNYVDITIRDEELPQSVSGNHFVVGDNHQLLNESDISNSVHYQKMKVTPEVAPDENISFMPVRNVEDENNVSSKESIKPDQVSNNTSQMQSINENSYQKEANFDPDKGIDTLPDMTGLSIGNERSSSENETEEDDDSEFVTSSAASVRSEAEVPEIKDASLYAKAISSILSGEED